MFYARDIAGLALAGAVLTGCAATTTQRAADAPALLNVVAVNVSATADTAVVGRSYTRSADEIATDVATAVTAALADSSNAEGAPVTVDVAVGEVALVDIAGRALAQTSTLTAVVSVTTEDGSPVVPEQAIVSGGGLTIPGAVGVVTTHSVEQDYSDTVAGFATTLENVIFPDQ